MRESRDGHRRRRCAPTAVHFTMMASRLDARCREMRCDLHTQLRSRIMRDEVQARDQETFCASAPGYSEYWLIWIVYQCSC